VSQGLSEIVDGQRAEARLKFLFARVVVIVTGLVPACGSSRVEKISRPSASPAPGEAALRFEAPTSKLGEMFQYSDLLVAAAGFVGGHVAYPVLEFVVDNGAKRTLKLREGQHKYTFYELL
jgi:hypothetical protein